MPISILVADNEFRSRKNVAQLLREEGYQVDEADDGVRALQLLEEKKFDLLICDVGCHDWALDFVKPTIRTTGNSLEAVELHS
jgi:CheY-like chemotaxis protein